MRFVENQLIFGIKSASSPCGICISSYFNNSYLNNVNPALEAADQIDFQRVVHLPALDNEVGLPGPEWLAIDKLLAYFAPEQHEEKRLDREKAQQRYINHVREGVGLPSVWEVLTGQIYLGDEKFIDKMSLLAAQNPTGPGARVSGSRREIPNIQRRPQPMALEAFERQHPSNRNAAVQAAFATGAYTMAQLAQHFQVHYTSV